MEAMRLTKLVIMPPAYLFYVLSHSQFQYGYAFRTWEPNA